MSRTASASASALFFVLAGATAFTVSACSSGDIAVGSSQQTQALKKNKNGTATGNGSTCSWDDAVSSDGTTTPAPNGPYKVGDTFPMGDGCNNCSCTKDGIACTTQACSPPPSGCTEEAKLCPDGSYVGRTGPNCDFAPCTPKACTEEAKQCPDGSSVSRTGPNCEFAPCSTGAQACSLDGPNTCPAGKTCKAPVGLPTRNGTCQ